MYKGRVIVTGEVVEGYLIAFGNQTFLSDLSLRYVYEVDPDTLELLEVETDA